MNAIQTNDVTALQVQSHSRDIGTGAEAIDLLCESHIPVLEGLLQKKVGVIVDFVEQTLGYDYLEETLAACRNRDLETALDIAQDSYTIVSLRSQPDLQYRVQPN